MILSCYEAMSGIKINFEKSEVFTVGLSEEDKLLAANALGYKIGVFPMKYLGMPVSYRKITKAQLKYVMLVTRLKRDWALGNVITSPQEANQL